jgi:hypothetical protein
MSHHGPSPFGGEEGPDFQKRQALMRELLNTTGFRGAVGSYPDGVLRQRKDDDEGLIQFAVGDQEGKVVIDFGTPVAWLGMTPQQAIDFAQSIISRARLVARKKGETLAITIG